MQYVLHDLRCLWPECCNTQATRPLPEFSRKDELSILCLKLRHKFFEFFQAPVYFIGHIKDASKIIMITDNRDSRKVRMGLAKCPACGIFYDPTATNGPCPQCSRRYSVATWVFALIVLAFLFLLPVPGAEAQVTPPACVVGAGGVVQCNYAFLPVVAK